MLLPWSMHFGVEIQLSRYGFLNSRLNSRFKSDRIICDDEEDCNQDLGSIELDSMVCLGFRAMMSKSGPSWKSDRRREYTLCEACCEEKLHGTGKSVDMEQYCEAILAFYYKKNDTTQWSLRYNKCTKIILIL